RDQGKYRFARACDASAFLLAVDYPRIERRAQFMLGEDDRIDLALGICIVLLDGGYPGVCLDDLRVAKSDFFGCLRIFGGLLRYASAAGERLPPRIDVFLLL